MHLLDPTDRDMGVERGRGEAGVPENLLNHPDVRSVFQEERGHRVPEHMATPFLSQPGGLDVPAD